MNGLSLVLTALVVFSHPVEALVIKTAILFNGGPREAQEKSMGSVVSKELWDFLVDPEINFDVPPWRRGFYGAETLADVSLYNLYAALSGHAPWTTMIHINQKCLTEGSVSDAEFGVGNHDRFADWYLRNRAKYQSLEKLCLDSYGDFSQWREGALFDVRKRDAQTQKETRLCGPVLEDFLEAEDIKLVADHANGNSWYVRDRACVNAVTGTPDELFEMILNNQIGDSDLMSNLYGDPVEPGRFFAGSTLLILQILSETHLLDADHFSALQTMRQAAFMEVYDGSSSALSIGKNEDNYAILGRAVQAALNAIRNHQTIEFQERLRKKMSLVIAALGNSCRGGEGVDRAHFKSCAQSMARATRDLVDAF